MFKYGVDMTRTNPSASPVSSSSVKWIAMSWELVVSRPFNFWLYSFPLQTLISRQDIEELHPHPRPTHRPSYNNPAVIIRRRSRGEGRAGVGLRAAVRTFWSSPRLKKPLQTMQTWSTLSWDAPWALLSFWLLSPQPPLHTFEQEKLPILPSRVASSTCTWKCTF